MTEWKLLAINLHDTHTWRSGVRSAMPAASQLSGRGPLMWMLPLSLHVNQKSNYDMICDIHRRIRILKEAITEVNIGIQWWILTLPQ